jgi:dipeptidyl aminopeptidase/acylaminoacyl peptidase
MVLPTFRGEPLQAGALGYFVSEGTTGMYNQDADDALALLDCVLNHYPEADEDRVVSLGISRGTQVAQRISQRGDGFVGAVLFYGMVDYWLPSRQQYLADDLVAAAEGSAGMSYVQKLYDGEYTIWDVRMGMAHWSTAYYADLFPRVQIHHGTDDAAVSVAQSDRLSEVLETVDGADFVYFRYEGGVHTPTSLPNCWPRVRSMLLDFL